MITFDPCHHNAREDLKQWIDQGAGAFSVYDLGIRKLDHDQKFLLSELLELLLRQGFLERYGRKRGWYIKTESDMVEQDYVNADAYPVDIWLPLKMADHVKIFSGNLIVFAGVPNMGKSCFILNMIKENRLKHWEQYLFNSESDAGELKERLGKFEDITLDMWNFKSYERYEDFHQVVRPGRNVINYIDFLELHDNFYIVGGLLKKIHNNLNGAIAVVALQKNPGAETGLGGFRTLEVTRLAVSIEFQKAKIAKAKANINPDFDMNYRYNKFKIYDGYKILSSGGWYREKDE